MPNTTPARTASPRRLVSVAAALALGLFGAILPVSAASAAGVATGTVLDQAGDPVVGVEVRINCGPSYTEIERIDTDQNGVFVTTSLPDGDCQAYLFEGEADFEDQWVSTALEFFVVSGAAVTIPDMVVARYVPVSGTIDNWTTAMGDVTVSLQEQVAPGVWQLVNNSPRPNYFDSVGANFTVLTPLEAEDYTLFFQFSDNVPYLDAYLGGELDDPTLAEVFTGVPNVGVSGLSMEMPEAAVISGRITGGGQPLEGVEVEADNGTEYGYAETDESGDYEIYVPAGTDYAVYAYGNNSYGGAYYYTGSDPCGCEYDPVATTLADPAEGIDIDLPYELAPVDIEVVALEDQQFQPLDGVEIRLYAPSGDGWVIAESEVIDVANAPYAYFSDVEQGRYRLQFVSGNRVLTITDGGTYSTVSTPFSPLPACFADLGDVDDSLDATAVVDAATAGGACAALPAPTAVTPPTTGGTGTTTTGPRRPAATAAGVAPSVVPTPTPTPTSSATPRPTVSPTPVATAPAEPAPASSPDLWWLLWVGLGLLVVVVIGGVVFFVRRT